MKIFLLKISHHFMMIVFQLFSYGIENHAVEIEEPGFVTRMLRVRVTAMVQILRPTFKTKTFKR